MPTVPALSIIRVESIVLFTPVMSSSMFCGHHTSQLLCLKTDTIRKHVSHRNKGKGNFNPSSFTYFRLWCILETEFSFPHVFNFVCWFFCCFFNWGT